MRHFHNIYITTLMKAMNNLCCSSQVTHSHRWPLISKVRICGLITRVNTHSQYRNYHVINLFLFQKCNCLNYVQIKMYYVAKLSNLKPASMYNLLPVAAATRIYMYFLAFIYLRNAHHTLKQNVTKTYIYELLVNQNDCWMQHFPISDVQE
jgi:hypothetical protein